MIRQTEIASARVALCVKYENGERALFACWGHDGSVFVAEKGFAPVSFNNFTAAGLACFIELGGKGNDTKAGGNPVTIARKQQAKG